MDIGVRASGRASGPVSPARPHDTGIRVTCEGCGYRFGPLGPGRQLCAQCRVEWSHARDRGEFSLLDDWLRSRSPSRVSMGEQSGKETVPTPEG